MWNHLTQYEVKPERKTLETVYQYLQLELLTNPKCNLVSNSSLIAGGKVFSREKGTLPESFENFRRQVTSSDWDVLMCSRNGKQRQKKGSIDVLEKRESAHGKLSFCTNSKPKRE